MPAARDPATDDALKKVGAAIRRQRVAVEMTQDDLAEAAGLHLRTVQKIEAGNINILITTMQRIRAGIGCTWDKLLD